VGGNAETSVRVGEVRLRQGDDWAERYRGRSNLTVAGLLCHVTVGGKM